LTLNAFLNPVASRTPTPGGGSVAAAAGALACAMARMVVAYSIGKDTEPGAAARANEIAAILHRADELLRALIAQDAVAYVQMTAAAKAKRDKPSKAGAYAEAVLGAIAVPTEMAAVVSGVLSVLDEFKTFANRHLITDLAVAAVLADASARAARYSVWINAREVADAGARSKILHDADRIVEHCARHCESVEGYVRSQLEVAGDASR
jgi:glutamate formiminotransferase/formiminotetrahydrofolate cyclodeaminase